jgi:hypothetical protein
MIASREIVPPEELIEERGKRMLYESERNGPRRTEYLFDSILGPFYGMK